MYKAVHFNCSNCDALYQLVRVVARERTTDRRVTCRVCGSPLPARKGEFICEYFLLRKATRRRKHAGRRSDLFRPRATDPVAVARGREVAEKLGCGISATITDNRHIAVVG